MEIGSKASHITQTEIINKKKNDIGFVGSECVAHQYKRQHKKQSSHSTNF
jgi:hypothetical protein